MTPLFSGLIVLLLQEYHTINSCSLCSFESGLLNSVWIISDPFTVIRENPWKESLTNVCLSTMPDLLGETFPTSQWSHTRGGGAYPIEVAEPASRTNLSHWGWCRKVERQALVLNQVARVTAHILWRGILTGSQVWPLVLPTSSVGWLELWVFIAHKGWR